MSTKFLCSLSEIPVKGKRVDENKIERFNDFDLQCKIIQLFQIDDFVIELRLIDDSDEIWHCHAQKSKNYWLKEG